MMSIAPAPESSRIRPDPARLAELCRSYRVRRLSFFGSVLRRDFGPDSDVDVLVEFDAERVPGFSGLVGMEHELSGIIGRKVDLRTPEELSRYFRDEVVAAAALQPLQLQGVDARHRDRLVAATSPGLPLKV